MGFSTLTPPKDTCRPGHAASPVLHGPVSCSALHQHCPEESITPPEALAGVGKGLLTPKTLSTLSSAGDNRDKIETRTALCEQENFVKTQ